MVFIFFFSKDRQLSNPRGSCGGATDDKSKRRFFSHVVVERKRRHRTTNGPLCGFYRARNAPRRRDVYSAHFANVTSAARANENAGLHRREAEDFVGRRQFFPFLYNRIKYHSKELSKSEIERTTRYFCIEESGRYFFLSKSRFEENNVRICFYPLYIHSGYIISE